MLILAKLNMPICKAALEALKVSSNPGRRSFRGVLQLARVERVYDGDTINVLTALDSREPYYEYSLRILGIDAPELTPPRRIQHRDLHVEAAKVARDRLRVLIPEKSIICVDYKPEDKYGRLLGTIYDDDWALYDEDPNRALTEARNLGQQLLEEGFVNEYLGRRKTLFTPQKLEEIIRLGEEYGL
jgi:endonuclease YncB( thermonuclease family)